MKGVVPFALLYGAYVVTLHAVDGPWRQWKVGREGRAIDPWTGQHVMWGAIAQRMGVSQGALFALGVVNEGIELATRTYRPDLLWGTPESPANVAVDLGSAAAGWWMASKLK